MSKHHHGFPLSALAAALLASQGAALAADADKDVEQLTKPESSVSAGVGGWSGDRPQQGIFDGMRNSGGYVQIDADVVKRDDATGTWNTFTMRNLGLDNPSMRLEHERQGSYGLFLDYNRISRDTPYVVSTSLNGTGTTQVISGAGVNALTPMRDLELEMHRDILQLGGFKTLSSQWTLNVLFKNEDKEGLRHWGRGGQPEFTVEPIDSTTRQLEVTLNYAGEKLQLTGGYYGSWYDNANSLVDTIRNGDAVGTLANHIYLSLPLDNEAHQTYVSGTYKLTPSTQANFKASYTHATQNEHLPTTDIAGLSWASAPTSLAGELNTTLVQLGLNSRPLPKLAVAANLRYYDVQDDTPTQRFIQTGAPGTTVSNTPMSYTTTTGKLEATYNLPDGYNLIGGIDYSKQDRSIPVGRDLAGVDQERYVPMRTDLDETTYRLQLRRNLSETLNGSLAFLHSDRGGSDYHEALHSDPGEGTASTSIDPINIANRKRDKVRLTLDWAPTERMGLQFNFEDAKDTYGWHTYGLRDGTAQMFSVDGNFTLNQEWQLTAWYSHDDTEAHLFGWREGSNGVTGNAELDKDAHLRDQGDSLGFGLKGSVNSKLKINADLQWTRNTSEIRQDLTALTISPVTGLPVATTGALLYANGTSPAPDIESIVTRIKLSATYTLKKNADIKVDLIHERWKTNDWTWQFADGTPFTYGATTDGTQVITKAKQTSNFLGIRYIYKF